MPKRCIGISLGRSHVYATQVARTAEGFRMEKAFGVQTRRSTDSIPAVLRSLTNGHGFDRRAAVAVCLPHHAFFFADMETDAEGLEKIRAADNTRLKDYFPVPAEDLIAQVCSVVRMDKDRSSVLVAATSRQQLREGLQSLREGKIRPACIDTPITAVHATLVANHPEATTGLTLILYVDSLALNLAVMHDGSLLLLRSIPMFYPDEQDAETFAQQTADIIAQEIEITWRKLFGNDPDTGLRIFLIAPHDMTTSLAPAIQDKTNDQVVPVNPFARVARSEEVDANLPLCIAEGLALRALGPPGDDRLDFLTAYQARTRPALRITKELIVCATLAAAAVVVWTAGLFLQLSSLESNYQQLKKQAEAIFREAVPEETNIVDPAAQLQQKLDAFRKECALLTGLHSGRSAPLEILYALSGNTPTTGNLQLQEVLIAAGSVRITGSCDSFATLSQWQRLLETIPGLRVVDIPGPKKDAQSGKVQFTILLSAGEDKA